MPIILVLAKKSLDIFQRTLSSGVVKIKPLNPSSAFQLQVQIQIIQQCDEHSCKTLTKWAVNNLDDKETPLFLTQLQKLVKLKDARLFVLVHLQWRRFVSGKVNFLGRLFPRPTMT